MKPPAGFKSEVYPLRHKFWYSFGLSVQTAAQNTTYCTLVKNYKSAVNASGIVVNPHNEDYVEETGAICNKMSIIDKLSLKLDFNFTKDAGTDVLKQVNFSWFPIFFSFPEKLDAADDDTGTTVAAILELTKDATQEDVTPLFATKLDVTPPSDVAHPVSTVNFTEVFGTLNLTTNTTMEGVALDYDLLMNALKRYTNKGALRACIGKIRHSFVSPEHPHKSVFIKKFVPKSIRRIMPYTYMAIAVHVPLVSEFKQHYSTASPSIDLSHLGVKIMCNYHEWNADHDQDAMEAV